MCVCECVCLCVCLCVCVWMSWDWGWGEGDDAGSDYALGATFVAAGCSASVKNRPNAVPADAQALSCVHASVRWAVVRVHCDRSGAPSDRVASVPGGGNSGARAQRGSLPLAHEAAEAVSAAVPVHARVRDCACGGSGVQSCPLHGTLVVQVLAVLGSCPQLGAWRGDKAVLLTPAAPPVPSASAPATVTAPGGGPAACDGDNAGVVGDVTAPGGVHGGAAGARGLWQVSVALPFGGEYDHPQLPAAALGGQQPCSHTAVVCFPTDRRARATLRMLSAACVSSCAKERPPCSGTIARRRTASGWG
jgi:hypothetical protein